MPVYNNTALTIDCINRITKYTTIPYEIILIDDYSEENVKKAIRNIKNLIYIKNTENKGFVASANTGLRKASYPYLLLLNNDTVPSYGWLDNMVGFFENPINVTSRKYILGPMTNSANPWQLLDSDFKNYDRVDKFCKVYNSHQHPIYKECNWVSGYCMLMHKQILKDVGYLDEGFYLGYYEDVDFCLRAKLQGYRCIISQNSYLHHLESKTFNLTYGEKNRKQLCKQSLEYFKSKWEETFDIDAYIANDKFDLTSKPNKSNKSLLKKTKKRKKTRKLPFK